MRALRVGISSPFEGSGVEILLVLFFLETFAGSSFTTSVGVSLSFSFETSFFGVIVCASGVAGAEPLLNLFLNSERCEFDPI